MTNKQRLFDLVKTYSMESYLALDMKLPYSEGLAETILVPGLFIFDKLTYVDLTYDDNLVMKNNPQIKILDFRLM